MKTITTSFPQFPELPAELRLQIFELAAPPPRTIELTWSSKGRTLISLTPSPPILRACHESRQCLLPKHHQLMFGDCSQVIPVNFERDTIFFGPGCKHMVPSGRSNPWVAQNPKVIRDIVANNMLRKNLKLVAFDHEFIRGIIPSEMPGILQFIGVSESLESITVVEEMARGEYLSLDEKMGNEPLSITRKKSVMAVSHSICTDLFVIYLRAKRREKVSVFHGKILRH